MLTGRRERKISHNNAYPKGYVEMLEQQQQQLVFGLRSLYDRLLKVSAWDGPPLQNSTGHPLTHDILQSLNLLSSKQDGGGDSETLEECSRFKPELIAEGSIDLHQRRSFGSDSEHSHHDHARPVYNHDTPSYTERPSSEENCSILGVTSTPLPQNSTTGVMFSPQPKYAHFLVNPELCLTPFSNDEARSYAPQWTLTQAEMNKPEQEHRAQNTTQEPDFDSLWSTTSWDYQLDFFNLPFLPYQDLLDFPCNNGTLPEVYDLGSLHSTEIDPGLPTTKQSMQ
jgi:hypothetical protein